MELVLDVEEHPERTQRPTLRATQRAQQTAALSLGDVGDVSVIAVSDGTLFVFASGANSRSQRDGRLLAFDEATQRQLSSWRAGPEPTAMTISATSAWIANGPDAGPSTDANAVLELSRADGHVMHRYHIASPTGIEYRDGAAWIVSGGVGNIPVTVERLTVGTKETVARWPRNITQSGGLLGPSTNCGDDLFVAITDDYLHLFDFNLPAHRVRRVGSIHVSGVATMSCLRNELLIAVANVDNGGLYVVNPSDGRVSKRFGRAFPRAVAAFGSAAVMVQDDPRSPAVLEYVGQAGTVEGARLLPVGIAGVVTASRRGIWVLIGREVLLVD